MTISLSSRRHPQLERLSRQLDGRSPENSLLRVLYGESAESVYDFLQIA
jgi:hypothetical protein